MAIDIDTILASQGFLTADILHICRKGTTVCERGGGRACTRGIKNTFKNLQPLIAQSWFMLMGGLSNKY
jgi:hypothetical protein